MFITGSLVENNQEIETKHERCEKKLRKKWEQVRWHGRSLLRIYRDAILKRVEGGEVKK